MRLQVQHITEYTYENQVFLGVHHLYLMPQYRLHFEIAEQSMLIDPLPENQSSRQDLSGNFYSLIWFSDLTNSLKITSSLGLELKSFNPFTFLVDDQFIQSFENSPYPRFNYSGLEKNLVSYFIFDDRVEEFQNLISHCWKGSYDLIGFLVRITSAIKERWDHIIRHEEDIWEPRFTFNSKKGSCRDLAWMLMNILGNLGLASRFISGYAFNPELNDGHELHAWLEVFLPGAGWIGLDPSLGLLTDHRYIPLAAHAKPKLASPVQGSFSGLGNSTLTTNVQIKLIES
ncbi:transglutaminase family protein [Algoriphagus sp.]|uniref:transglutaminase family protein n=1 Tax=Algoriphagus sp. TaxID=1872435 RepID=UPI0025F99E2B|nr:transglutaminase family protein [Algoriphagus sp.]